MTFADIGDWVTESTSLFSNTTIISIYMRIKGTGYFYTQTTPFFEHYSVK